MSVLLTGIGELTTNDPARDGLLGLVEDAAVVVEGSTIAWVGPAAEAPAVRHGVRRRRARRRARLGGQPQPPGVRGRPGAGVRRPDDRGALLRRRHPHHRRGHPRGHRRTAHLTRRPARRRDAGPGHHHHRDQEWIRTLRPRRGAVARRGPPVHGRDDLPRCPRRAGGHHPRRLRRAGHRPDAGGRGPPCALDRRLLRGRRLRRRPGTHDPGSGHRQRPARTAPRQPADLRRRGPAGRRARPGRGRPLHLPVRRRRQRARRLGHHRHAAARGRVLHPAPVRRRPPPPRRRACGSRWPATATRARASPRRWRSASRWPSGTWG